ncbi:hypothetical protein AB0E06_37260 [Streptomyces sp. NPDC048109]
MPGTTGESGHAWNTSWTTGSDAARGGNSSNVNAHAKVHALR